jgi:hypothetical protein
MQVITIPSNIEYTNLYTLSGFAAGTSLLVTNNTSSTLSINQSEAQPADSSESFPVISDKTILVQANEHPIWIRGNTGPVVVQSLLETVVPFTGVDLPHDLYTSDTESFRRFRVDVGQTGLFEGREFRMVRKVIIPSGTPLVFRFTTAVDFILLEQEINCSVGDIEYYAWRDSQGAAGGTFTALPIPPINKNISASFREYEGLRYATQVALATGGTFTPTDAEVYVDYDRAKTSGATAQQISVQGGNDSVRYLAAGTYYLKLTSLVGTSEGRFSLAWEERP